MAKTSVYRVVYVDETGNHNALVFQKPADGKSYKAGEVVFFGDQGQTSFARANDEGDIPHREPSSDIEDLGLTWHNAK